MKVQWQVIGCKVCPRTLVSQRAVLNEICRYSALVTLLVRR
ncbi:hypothetical protein FHW72_002357 [Ochrobactrum sp. RC6B]|nr:hypothetical protein [Ochrobactrum sp. RC6B]NYD80420.1 hypothetical protein [Brucella intermedia]